MRVTYFGHSCFGVELGGKNILFDPFIEGNELAAHIDIASIKADYILLSHGHSDHTADAISIAKANGATVVASYEVAVWAGNQGVAYHPMNTGGKWHFDFGTVKCVSAVHSSSLPDGTYGGNPMGFIIESGHQSMYYSGDTALTLDMQLIPKFANITWAALPIGDNFTMGIQDAILAAKMAECTKVMGVHYDTFGYIKIDKNSAVAQFKLAGIDLFLPGIGDTLDF